MPSTDDLKFHFDKKQMKTNGGLCTLNLKITCMVTSQMIWIVILIWHKWKLMLDVYFQELDGFYKGQRTSEEVLKTSTVTSIRPTKRRISTQNQSVGFRVFTA